jgi:flagellar hook-basal body complex protein FliE
MTIPSVAAGAYSALQRVTSSLQQDPLSTKGDGGSFGSMLENALGKVVAQGHNADSKAQQLAAGKGDIIDVVTAVADSEVAVQTLVSVRDKMISAYEDILKMPI